MDKPVTLNQIVEQLKLAQKQGSLIDPQEEHFIVLCGESFKVKEVSPEVFLTWLATHHPDLAEDMGLPQLKEESEPNQRRIILALAITALVKYDKQFYGDKEFWVH